MVAADERDAIGVADFEAEKEKERLQGIESAIDKITHEQIIGVRDISSDTEELHQVVELAVDITAYCDGSIHADDVPFLDEDLSGFIA